MSIDTLINKTGRKIATAGLAGLLSFSALGLSPKPVYAQQNAKSPSGNIVYVHCTPQQKQTVANETKNENWGELLSVLGIMGLGSNKPDAQQLGAMSLKLGEMQHQKEVARKGRSQININEAQQKPASYFPAPGCAWENPENPNDLRVRKSIGLPFGANNVQDLNDDGKINLSEFFGVKDRFYDDEKMLLFLYNQTGTNSARNVKYSVYDPQGNKLFENSINDNLGIVCLGRDGMGRDGKFASELPKYGGYGLYTIAWSSEGITEIFKFEIRPASERPDKKQ